jgi:hypothetical protein
MALKKVKHDGSTVEVEKDDVASDVTLGKRYSHDPISNDAVSWRNTRAEIIKEFICYVPRKISDIMKTANRALPNDEFSFFVKCDIDYPNRVVYVTDSWFFPRQEVSAASVNYKEDNSEYNGVIHKHPGALKTFSVTDDNYINQNFQVSLLWVVNDGFVNGRINIPTEAGRVQLKLNIVTQDDINLMSEVTDIVKEKTTRITYANTTTGAGGYKYPGKSNYHYDYGKGGSYNRGSYSSEHIHSGASHHSPVSRKVDVEDNRTEHEKNRDFPPFEGREHEKVDAPGEVESALVSYGDNVVGGEPPVSHIGWEEGCNYGY